MIFRPGLFWWSKVWHEAHCRLRYSFVVVAEVGVYMKADRVAALVTMALGLVTSGASAQDAPRTHPHTISPWGSKYFGGADQMPDTFMLLENGERVGGWRVAGQRGNIGWTSGSYTHHGFTFPSQQPNHETTGIWVNLAGISQSATGLVHSPVPTKVGTSYTLTFSVGNVYDPNGTYGTSSTINLYFNTKFVGSFTNSDGQGTTTLNWKPFSVTFTADTPYTSVAFINGDPPGDMVCGLDSTDLVATAADAQGEAR